MQLRTCPQLACRFAYQSNAHQQYACGDHHGPCTTGQCHALWSVHQPIESDGGVGNFRGLGRSNSDAMYSRDPLSVDARVSDCVRRESARFKQHIEVDVQLGGRNYHNPSRSSQRNDSMMLVPSGEVGLFATFKPSLPEKHVGVPVLVGYR